MDKKDIREIDAQLGANMKLTRKQWEFLELVERSPMDGPSAWKRCSEPVHNLYTSLNIPFQLCYAMRKEMNGETVYLMTLTSYGECLLKYGTCPND